MKNYIRQYAYCIGMLLLLVCSTGCEQDETIELIEQTNISIDYKETSLKRVNVKDIKPLNAFISSKVKGKIAKNSSNKSVLQTPFGTVNLEDVMEVTNPAGHVNYTFRIKTEDFSPKTFYNFIVHTYPSGDQEAYILEYVMSDSFAVAYFNGEKKIEEFQGTLKKYDFDSYQRAKEVRAKPSNCPPDGDSDGPVDVPCLVEDIDLGDDGINDGDIPTPIGDEVDGSNGSNGGGGTNTNGSPDSGGESTGAISLECITSFSYCCNNNFCDPHGPRPKYAGGPDCSGSIVEAITSCVETNNIVNTTDSLAKRGRGCGIGGGTVGIDPLGFDNASALVITIGIEGMEYLNANCDKRRIIGQVWENDKSSANANFLAGIVRFWRDNPAAEDAFFIGTEIINSVEREELSMQEGIAAAITILKVMNEEASVASLIDINYNKIYARVAGLRINLAGSDFIEFFEALSNLDPDDVLNLGDWLRISGNLYIIKQLLGGYPATKPQIKQRALEVSLLAPIKSLVGDSWPQTDAEWKVIQDILTPLLLEVGIAIIPGSDIINLVQSVADNDYVEATIAIAGLGLDFFGGTIIKAIAKFGRAVYKGFKIARAVGDFLAEVGQVIARGFKLAYENSAAVLKDAAGRILARGDNVGRYASLITKTDNLPDVRNFIENITDSDMLKRLDDLPSDQLTKLDNLIKNQKKPAGYNGQFNFTATKNNNGLPVSVKYDQNGFPDFTPHASSSNHVFSADNLAGNGTDMTRANNFIRGQANVITLSNGKVKINGIEHTWHHHQDGISMFPVPSHIHNVRSGGFPHSGGAAIIDRGLQGLFDGPKFD